VSFPFFNAQINLFTQQGCGKVALLPFFVTSPLTPLHFYKNGEGRN